MTHTSCGAASMLAGCRLPMHGAARGKLAHLCAAVRAVWWDAFILFELFSSLRVYSAYMAELHLEDYARLVSSCVAADAVCTTLLASRDNVQGCTVATNNLCASMQRE